MNVSRLGEPDPLPDRRRAAARWRPPASRPARRRGAGRRARRCSPRSRGRRRRPARCRASVSTGAGPDRGDPGAARGSTPPSRSTAAGQAADQPGRVDRRAVGGVGRRRARRSRRARARASAASSSRRSSSPRPQRRACATSVAGPAQLDRRAGDGDRAALGEVGVDALRGGDPAAPRRRWPASPGAGASASLAVDAGQRGQPSADAGNSAEHQPPLRPEAPNPAVSASSTRDPQRRVGRGAGSRRSTAR